MKIDIPLEVIQSMKKIVDMFIEDESKHYDIMHVDTVSDFMRETDFNVDEAKKRADDICKDHIYNDLELVNRFIHSQDLQADIDFAEREF